MFLPTIRNMRRVALAFALSATAGLPWTHAGAAVDSIVVKFHSDSVASSDATMSLDLAQRVAAGLQSGFAASGRTRDGAYRITLNPPLSDAEARSALARLRMDKSVLYANGVAARPAATATTARDLLAGPPTDRIIVKYRDPVTTDALRAGSVLTTAEVNRIGVLAAEPVAFVRGMHDGAAVFQAFRHMTLAQVSVIADRIAQQPDVEFAQPDYRKFPQLVPTDPCYAAATIGACSGNFQWDLFEAVGGVNMPGAWDVTTGSVIQRVAVIDTGSLPHPDLAGRIVGGYDFIDDAVVANDVDPVLGCYPSGPNPCFGSRDANPLDAGDWITAADNAGSTFGGWLAGCFVDDSSWHGTHVAGTIGANASNGIGVTGINWVSSIVHARVLGKCGGYTSDIADSMVWVSGGTVPNVPANPHPARVMNLSLGGYLGSPAATCPANDPTSQNAINVALANGSVVVVSAGNSNADAGPYSPASCNGVITVAATTRNGGRAFYSNFGQYVEIGAPGGSRTANDATTRPSILSTLNSGTTTYNPSGFNYVNYAGTSMAAPHVAGIASLMLSIGPELSPAQVTSIIQTTARAFPSGTLGDCVSGTPTGSQRYCGAGIIDGNAAVLSAMSKGGISRAGSRRDFNGNDRSDITWFNTSSGQKLLWLMNGGSVAGGGTLLTDLNWSVTHFGDFNKDGATDLVWRNSVTGQTVLWLMNGASYAGGGVIMNDANWVVRSVGDFNFDGRSDLLWRNSATGEVVVWLMNGTAIIGSNTLLTDINWVPALVGDFNGDGKDDVLWRNTASGQTVIWLLNGAAFLSGGAIMSDPNWTATHLGDFNGDGKADIVWRHSNGSTAVWLMNGTALLGGAGLLSDPNWFVAGVDDLNGDGKSDILWRHTAGNTAAWLMNGAFLSAGGGLLPAPWLITRTGDFNGDGRADILWTNPGNGQKVMWLMSGLGPTAGFTLSADPAWMLDP